MQLLKAIACQILAGLLAILLKSCCEPPFISVGLLALQPVLAAGFSRLLRQPVWWLPIHLIFMPLAWLSLKSSLPPWIYLSLFILLLSIFWGTVIGDVPLFFSSPPVSDAVADIIAQNQPQSLIDLGAGLGSLVIPIAQRFPHLEITAIEQAPIPWLILSWRCRGIANIRVRRANFWACHLAGYDMVFAFLSPSVMSRLNEKCQKEMNNGAVLLSSRFPLPERPTSSLIGLKNKPSWKIYCYKFVA